MSRWCAVSVDLDGIEHYRHIHGLAPARNESTLVYRLALPRAIRFARSVGVPMTLFAIGRDLDDERASRALRIASEQGHVVENHSHTHRYDLARGDPERIATEVRCGAARIATVTGRRPRGFRSPGYGVSRGLFDALEREGVAWDSSVFPSAPYYAAKLAALGWGRLRRRRSGAVVGDPRALAAPRVPYRPAEAWHRRGSRPLLELPISVTRRARLPLLGTVLSSVGEAGARWLVGGCIGDALVNVELHGLDFLDRGDGLEELGRHQLDLRFPAGAKMRALRSALEVLREAGYRFVTLDAAAEAMGAPRH